MSLRLHAAIVVVTLCIVALCAGCSTAPPEEPRASRRAYDGAPPVIGHPIFAIDCRACHSWKPVEVEGYGWSPSTPHQMGGSFLMCRQCHVTARTQEIFKASTFQPLEQDLRAGRRAHQGAPPVIPHRVFMRENCLGCHDGPGSREEIRTSHPERERCTQCHVEQQVPGEWLPEPPAAG